VVAFDAASRAAVLEQALRTPGRFALTVRLEGPAAELAGEVVLDVGDGRLIDARAADARGLDALVVLALADRGRVDVGAAPTAVKDSARFPTAIALVRQAEVNAKEVAVHLAPLGGLGAIPMLVRERSQEAGMPEAAAIVLALVDGASTVASILRRAPHPIGLTARILERLVAAGAVGSSRTALPEPIDDREKEEDREVEGAAASADVARFLQGEETPSQLASSSAFTSAFAVPPDAPARAPTPRPGTTEPIPDRSDRFQEISARVRQRVPLETKRPSPADPTDDDLAAAGVGAGRARGWIGIAGIGALIGVLAGLIITKLDLARRDPPAITSPPIVETSTVVTATTSTAALPILVDGRPPIAGPDAPEDVKRAEALLDAGRYREARELLDQLRATRPGDVTVWILSGQVEVDVGRLEVANGLSDRAIELDPKSYRAWVLQGSVLQFRGRFPSARTAYQRALALDPRHPMTREIQSVLEQMDRAQ
jgi:hypothetical protein